LRYGSRSCFTDGGFAIVKPYAAETWPTKLRTTGMGSACEFAWEDIRAGQFGPHYGIGQVMNPEATTAGLTTDGSPMVPLMRV
jgi:hypothetical protein